MRKRGADYKVIGGVVIILLLAFFISFRQESSLSTGEITRSFEEEVTLRGMFEIIHGEKWNENAPPQSLYWYYLVTGDGKRYALRGAIPSSIGGMIEVKGTKITTRTGKTLEISPMGLVDGVIKVREMEEVVLSPSRNIISEEKVTGNTVVQPYAVLKRDEIRVAVILFNFQNNPTQPFTLQQVYNTVFANTGNTAATGSLKKYYEEIGGGKVEMIGDIYGWYTIPYSSMPCQSQAWSYAALQAAATDGFDVHNYDMFIYIMPSASSCGANGWGLDTSQSAYLNGLLNAGVIAHEFSHALRSGLSHANSLTCTDAGGNKVTINPSWESCASTEYGDPFDVMGSTAWTNIYHLNDHFKNRVSLLHPQNTLMVTQSGIYTLKPLEKATMGVQALKILREIDSAGTAKFYYLEFRQPYGFDTFAASAPVVNGVTIRLSSDVLSSYIIQDKKTNLLDTTPATASFSDATLLVGKTFTDPFAGISITTLSVSPTEARVQVTVPPPTTTCVRANPAVNLVPRSQYGWPGETLIYTVQVKNLDNAACGVSTFSTTGSLGPAFTQSPASFQLTIPPGGTREKTIAVTRLSTATPGLPYSINEFVTNTAAPAFKSAGAAYYVTM